MSIKINNFIGSNENLSVLESAGIFTVYQHDRDLSVTPTTAQTSYYMSSMDCCPKQVLVNLKNNAIRLKPGAMQFMSGDIEQTTGLKGVGDFALKSLKGKVTGDAAIKPLYKGTGILVTEPTYHYPIIVNVDEWGGSLSCDDGMFICCDDEVKDDVQARSNLSSAVLGGEGLFNLKLTGSGYVVLKSRCPREELYEIVLENDCIKIDGNNAVCWSSQLQFTTERSGKTLLGSGASGEGLVNVFRGSGKILMSPLK